MWMCLYTLLCIAPFKCNYITIKGRTTKLKRLTFLFGPDDALEVIKLWRLWYLLAKRTEYFCHLCDSCMALLYAWSLISTGSATLLTERIVIGYTLLRLTRPIMRLEKSLSVYISGRESSNQMHNGTMVQSMMKQWQPSSLVSGRNHPWQWTLCLDCRGRERITNEFSLDY